MDRVPQSFTSAALPENSAATVESLLRTILRTSGLSLNFRLHAAAPGAAGPALVATFEGPDVPHLLARNAELLLALEHIAAKALHLEPEQHDLISFDAGGFKAQRERAIQRAADNALRQVQLTGRPFHFPPMNSRERRLLHLALTPSGLPTRSEGEGPTRHLVLHPARPSGSS